MTIKIGGQKTSIVFSVALKLANKMNLGTAFIGKEIVKIVAISRQFVLRSGHAVAIVERFKDEDAV